MSNVPNELKYTDSHEWVRDDGDGTVTVGITDHAQELLGDLVFVELPEVGATLDCRQRMRRGRVGQGRLRRLQPGQRRGDRGQRGPGRCARDRSTRTPTSDGWIFKLKLADAAELDG